RLPPTYFEWNFDLPGAGSYDLAGFFANYPWNMSQATFEVLDAGRVVATTTRNLSDTNVLYGPSTFNDDATYPNGSIPLPWVPLGRYAFNSTTGGLRVSGPENSGNAQCELLRVAKADGSSHFHVVTDSPPS